MLTQWEVYKDGPTKSTRDRIHVTINHKGVLLLNRRAFELLGEPPAVVLMYDKVNSVIGIQSAYPKLPEAFPVKSRAGYVWEIRAAPFCRHHRISLDRTMRFPDADLDSDNVLTLKLRDLVAAGWREYKTRGRGRS
jgi:hypothetical protein